MNSLGSDGGANVLEVDREVVDGGLAGADFGNFGKDGFGEVRVA